MTLLDECIVALGSESKVFEKVETLEISHKIQSLVEFTSWGRVDIKKYPKAIEVTSVNTLSEIANNYKIDNLDFYIMWNDASCPIISANFSKIINCIDDVTAVSFDTWVFNFDNRLIIEFYHEGEISLIQF